MRDLLSSILAMLVAANAFAQVSVEAPWVRESLPQQQATGAFMRLHADAADVRLVGASSPLAEVAEIHEMRMTDNIARMQRVDAIPLKAGETVDLMSGGYHLMLMGLKGPMRKGQVVPLTLVFEYAGGRRESVTIGAPVRPLTAGSEMHHSK